MVWLPHSGRWHIAEAASGEDRWFPKELKARIEVTQQVRLGLSNVA